MTITILLAAAGAALLFFCIVPITSGVFGIGSVTGIACGLLLVVLALMPARTQLLSSVLLLRLGVILAAAYAIFAAVTAIFMIIACRRHPPGNATLVVLGCQVRGDRPSTTLAERIDAACRYLQKHPGACAVLSGGQGKDEEMSEARCMKIRLLAAGISEKRLFLEEHSTSTRENLRFSCRIIDEEGLDPHIAIVSSEYHILRALMIARSEGIHASALPSRTFFMDFLPAFLREVWALALQLLCTLYFHLTRKK